MSTSASQPRIDFISNPASRPLTGRLRVPGDKSISHRSLMFGAVAEGTTHISGILEGEDVIATLNAFRAMGVDIERKDNHEVIVQGVGLHGLQAPSQPLDLGNSGTAVRLFTGLLAGQTFNTELRGDASLMKRPMRRVTEPLQKMGANIQCTDAGTLPVVVHGGSRLHGIDYVMPVASAQLKSALLLAGLYASGQTCVEEPAVTRDHTERMLTYFGCPVERSGNRVCVRSHALTARDINVPGDISSAAFFMVAASIVPGSDIVLENVGINPTRHAVIEILTRMGADIDVQAQGETRGEPVADIRVRYSQLTGINIPVELVPIAIDEFPAIFIAAACAEGETVLSDAAELRVKESDRIQAMCDGLRQLGIEAVDYPDGMRVLGGRMGGGEVDSHTDHRIAMSFAIAGLVAGGTVTVRDCINVNTSFPGFVELARTTGMDIQAREG